MLARNNFICWHSSKTMPHHGKCWLSEFNHLAEIKEKAKICFIFFDQTRRETFDGWTIVYLRIDLKFELKALGRTWASFWAPKLFDTSRSECFGCDRVTETGTGANHSAADAFRQTDYLASLLRHFGALKSDFLSANHSSHHYRSGNQPHVRRIKGNVMNPIGNESRFRSTHSVIDQR